MPARSGPADRTQAFEKKLISHNSSSPRQGGNDPPAKGCIASFSFPDQSAKRECRVARPHAGVDGGIGRRRDQFDAAGSFDPLHKITGNAATGINNKEHHPPNLHGLLLGHRFKRALRRQQADAEARQAVIVDEATVQQLDVAHGAVTVARIGFRERA